MENIITEKSRTFDSYLKYEYSPLMINPIAIIFINASTTKIIVITVSIMLTILLSSFFTGSSKANRMLEIRIINIMKYSKAGLVII